MPVKVRLAVDVVRRLRAVTDGKTMRVEDIATELGCSKNYLHQVVSVLNKWNIVKSNHGPNGGLVMGMRDTNLLELYEILGYLEPAATARVPSTQIEKQVRDFMAAIAI